MRCSSSVSTPSADRRSTSGRRCGGLSVTKRRYTLPLAKRTGVGACFRGWRYAAPRDPVDHHRRTCRTAGRGRLHGHASQHGCERAFSRRGCKSASGAGFRRSRGLRGEMAPGGQGEVPPGAPALGQRERVSSIDDGLVNQLVNSPSHATWFPARSSRYFMRSCRTMSCRETYLASFASRRSPVRSRHAP